MLSISVTILVHDDINHYSIANDEQKLKMFKYKEENN